MRPIILLLLTILSLTSNKLLAYPISPRPLRQLVLESPYIIVGFVVKTYELKDEKDERSYSRIAKIAVIENLQGQLKYDTIEVVFTPGMICPSPDRYVDSTFVISFIERDKKSGRFYTHALSYGAKTLEKAEIEIYKSRISEIQQILKIKDQKLQIKETVEWLVKCAENETTRWEGTYELSPESNFMSYYSRSKNEDFKINLTPEQKERLKKALLSSTGFIDFGLVDLVYRENEEEIDKFLLSELKALDSNYYWIADSFMDRLKHKNNSTEMENLLVRFGKIQFEYDKQNEIKTIISEFISLVDK